MGCAQTSSVVQLYLLSYFYEVLMEHSHEITIIMNTQSAVYCLIDLMKATLLYFTLPKSKISLSLLTIY